MKCAIAIMLVASATACSADAEKSALGPDATPDTSVDTGAGDAATEVAADAPAEAEPETPLSDATDDAPPTEDIFAEPCGNTPGMVFTPGLQFSGSVAFIHPKPGAPGMKERVSISAPIFPKVLVMYTGEGAAYPTTAAARAKLAHDSALPFCLLIGDCAASYPSIKTKPPLTASELSNNYDQVATCAYAKYTAKPYWIPQLVSDVDICKNEVGAGFRMITEADLYRLTDADLAIVKKALTTSSGGGFYFSLQVYVRATDGSIAQGSLSAGVTTKVTPFPSGTDLKLHYEGGLALRCIKIADTL